jgi:hypothetical protein
MIRSDRMKVLAVAGLLLVSAGAAIATLGSDAPAQERSATDASAPGSASSSSGGASSSSSSTTVGAQDVGPSDYEGNVLEEWSGSFDSAPSTGHLDLRMDHGHVKVVAWDKPRYRVMLLQQSQDGQSANDYETKADFQDQSSGDAIDITLHVDREGTYGVGVDAEEASTEDPHPRRAVVAFVPAGTSYEDVNVCSGERHAFEQTWEDAWGSVPWPWSEDDPQVHPSCLKQQEQAGVAPTVYADGDEEQKLGVERTGVHGLEASTLRLATEYGDLAVEDTDAGTLAALTGSGPIDVRNVAAENATFLTSHGDVLIAGASGADLAAVSGGGDLAVDHTPTADGTVALYSEYGEVDARVPAPGEVAYDVDTRTDHGDLTVALEDTSVDHENREDNRSWQDPSYWMNLFEDDGYEKSASAQTDNWGDDAIQTGIRAATEDGDIVVTDGTQPADLGDEGDNEDDEDGRR